MFYPLLVNKTIDLARACRKTEHEIDTILPPTSNSERECHQLKNIHLLNFYWV